MDKFERETKAIIACFVVMVILIAIVSFSQVAPASKAKYSVTQQDGTCVIDPCFTEVQSLKLENAQKDVAIVQREYQSVLQNLANMAEQFRKDNKWRDGMIWDGQNLRYIEPVVTPKPKESEPDKK